jgi:hypothetical protein
MKKSKSKSKAVVRGPQVALKFTRTPRLRYMEPPTHSDGNPFFALRVPKELLVAFKALAKKKGTPATKMVRAFMCKATGVKLGVGSDE